MSDTPVDLVPVSPDLCPSCGAERHGPFCFGCGQRFPEGRLTLRGLWQQLPARIFNLNRGLLHTFLELSRRPGRVARNFVAGQRSPYTNPLAYFLLAATLQLLALTFTESLLIENTRQQLADNPRALEQIGDTLGPDPGLEVGRVYVSVVKKIYTYAFLLFFTLPFAVYLRVLARFLKPTYNLAELSVFSIYTSGQLLIFTALIAPFTTWVGVAFHGFLSLAVYVVIGGIAARGFFDGGLRRMVLTWLSMAGAMVTFIIVLGIAFVIGLVLRIVEAQRAAGG